MADNRKDGGAGRRGVMVAADKAGWVKVVWDNGRCESTIHGYGWTPATIVARELTALVVTCRANSYRVGADNACDLAYAPDQGAFESLLQVLHVRLQKWLARSFSVLSSGRGEVPAHRHRSRTHMHPLRVVRGPHWKWEEQVGIVFQ